MSLSTVDRLSLSKHRARYLEALVAYHVANDAIRALGGEAIYRGKNADTECTRAVEAYMALLAAENDLIARGRVTVKDIIYWHAEWQPA